MLEYVVYLPTFSKTYVKLDFVSRKPYQHMDRLRLARWCQGSQKEAASAVFAIVGKSKVLDLSAFDVAAILHVEIHHSFQVGFTLQSPLGRWRGKLAQLVHLCDPFPTLEDQTFESELYLALPHTMRFTMPV